MSDPPAFDDAQIVYLDEHYGGASSQNVHWMIFNGVLVFLMQCGFAMLCAGSVRAKNAQNILLKNLVDTCVGAMGFWATGYAFAYGDPSRRSRGNAFIGTKYFFLSGGVENTAGYENWFFQFAFAATAATIVSGAVAERCHLRAYAGYSAALTAFVYPVVAHWSWSRDGWLSNDLHDPLIGIGVVDFAGSGVVHMVGGRVESTRDLGHFVASMAWNLHAILQTICVPHRSAAAPRVLGRGCLVLE
jgi:Amt family ammonium transporter